MQVQLQMKETYEDYFRFCANCRCFYGNTDLYCVGCWKKIVKEVQQTRKSEIEIAELEKINGHHLINWEEGNGELIANLIYSLKGGGLKIANQRLALFLVQEFLANNRQLDLNHFVVVPAPAKIPGDHDHAYQLASSISSLLKIPICEDLLRVNSKKQQKDRSKQEREKLKFINVEDKRRRGILFVDDVITTGTTILAGYKALKRPSNFYYLSLVYREKRYHSK